MSEIELTPEEIRRVFAAISPPIGKTVTFRDYFDGLCQDMETYCKKIITGYKKTGEIDLTSHDSYLRESTLLFNEAIARDPAGPKPDDRLLALRIYQNVLPLLRDLNKDNVRDRVEKLERVLDDIPFP